MFKTDYFSFISFRLTISFTGTNIQGDDYHGYHVAIRATTKFVITITCNLTSTILSNLITWSYTATISFVRQTLNDQKNDYQKY